MLYSSAGESPVVQWAWSNGHPLRRGCTSWLPLEAHLGVFSSARGPTAAPGTDGCASQGNLFTVVIAIQRLQLGSGDVLLGWWRGTSQRAPVGAVERLSWDMDTCSSAAERGHLRVIQ